MIFAYSGKSTHKFDKLRDLVNVHSEPTSAGEHSSCSPHLDRSALRRPDPEAVGDRYDTPLARIRQRVASLLQAGQLSTDNGWTRQTTSVVTPGGSAHILQNDRLSV